MTGQVRKDRRGANAIEFALVMPVLLGMLIGVMDYGWFFFRESMVTNAMRDGVRLGGLRSPAVSDVVGCSPCSTAAVTEAVNELAELGIPSAPGNFSATVESLDGGATCAVVMTTSLPHAQFSGFLPIPNDYPIRVAAIAQNVTACP